MLFCTLIIIVGVFLIRPIAQSISYHDFADKRKFLGIPNFANVISNIPFLFVGLAGLRSIVNVRTSAATRFTYAVMFSGIFLTGLGSGYYHYAPDNDSLVYDRIPMTLVFMSLLSATIAELIDARLGRALLLPLLIVGVGSVLWWHYTERAGHGDLRLYGLVQFYPLLFIPLIMGLFPSRFHRRSSRQLLWVVVWYMLAKIGEAFDPEIFSWTGFISGHSLKHLTAAIATWYLVRLYRMKYTGLPNKSEYPE